MHLKDSKKALLSQITHKCVSARTLAAYVRDQIEKRLDVLNQSQLAILSVFSEEDEEPEEQIEQRRSARRLAGTRLSSEEIIVTSDGRVYSLMDIMLAAEETKRTGQEQMITMLNNESEEYQIALSDALDEMSNEAKELSALHLSYDCLSQVEKPSIDEYYSKARTYLVYNADSLNPEFDELANIVCDQKMSVEQSLLCLSQVTDVEVTYDDENKTVIVTPGYDEYSDWSPFQAWANSININLDWLSIKAGLSRAWEVMKSVFAIIANGVKILVNWLGTNTFVHTPFTIDATKQLYPNIAQFQCSVDINDARLVPEIYDVRGEYDSDNPQTMVGGTEYYNYTPCSYFNGIMMSEFSDLKEILNNRGVFIIEFKFGYLIANVTESKVEFAFYPIFTDYESVKNFTVLIQTTEALGTVDNEHKNIWCTGDMYIKFDAESNKLEYDISQIKYTGSDITPLSDGYSTEWNHVKEYMIQNSKDYLYFIDLWEMLFNDSIQDVDIPVSDMELMLKGLAASVFRFQSFIRLLNTPEYVFEQLEGLYPVDNNGVSYDRYNGFPIATCLLRNHERSIYSSPEDFAIYSRLGGASGGHCVFADYASGVNNPRNSASMFASFQSFLGLLRQVFGINPGWYIIRRQVDYDIRTVQLPGHVSSSTDWFNNYIMPYYMCQDLIINGTLSTPTAEYMVTVFSERSTSSQYKLKLLSQSSPFINLMWSNSSDSDAGKNWYRNRMNALHPWAVGKVNNDNDVPGMLILSLFFSLYSNVGYKNANSGEIIFTEDCIIPYSPNLEFKNDPGIIYNTNAALSQIFKTFITGAAITAGVITSAIIAGKTIKAIKKAVLKSNAEAQASVNKLAFAKTPEQKKTALKDVKKKVNKATTVNGIATALGIGGASASLNIMDLFNNYDSNIDRVITLISGDSP